MIYLDLVHFHDSSKPLYLNAHSKSSIPYYYIVVGVSTTGEIWYNGSNFSLENLTGWMNSVGQSFKAITS